MQSLQETIAERFITGLTAQALLQDGQLLDAIVEQSVHHLPDTRCKLVSGRKHNPYSHYMRNIQETVYAGKLEARMTGLSEDRELLYIRADCADVPSFYLEITLRILDTASGDYAVDSYRGRFGTAYGHLVVMQDRHTPMPLTGGVAVPIVNGPEDLVFLSHSSYSESEWAVIPVSKEQVKQFLEHYQ